jgi:hypothetical protein
MNMFRSITELDNVLHAMCEEARLKTSRRWRCTAALSGIIEDIRKPDVTGDAQTSAALTRAWDTVEECDSNEVDKRRVQYHLRS